MTEQDKKIAMYEVANQHNKITELRETTAKYMGFTPVSPKGHYKHCIPVSQGYLTGEWKPDENSSQADMVEDKLREDEIITGIILRFYEDGVGASYLYHKQHVERFQESKEYFDKIKKLARALALEKACKKSMK